MYADAVKDAHGVVMSVNEPADRRQVRWFNPSNGQPINLLGVEEGWPAYLLETVSIGEVVEENRAESEDLGLAGVKPHG